jgi:hypothetical protein
VSLRNRLRSGSVDSTARGLLNITPLVLKFVWFVATTAEEFKSD